MSGAGKSFWAAKFAAQGFSVVDCDALIAARIQALGEQLGTSLEEVGQWMGMPDQPGFRRREALYLACETGVLRDVLDRAVAWAASHTNCVIDTSGSAIYADTPLLQRLRQHSTVIYFRIPETLHQHMLDTYLAHPRPVVWNGLFEQAPAESRVDAFRRSYALLLRRRERLYEQHSDVTLEYHYYRQPSLSVNQFVQDIRAATAQAPEHGKYSGTIDPV
jgi:shikimate kinase